MKLKIRGFEFIRMEYAELPGLQLTFWQVQRLWRLSNDECASALKALIDMRYLIRTDRALIDAGRWSWPSRDPLTVPREASDERRRPLGSRQLKPAAGWPAGTLASSEWT